MGNVVHSQEGVFERSDEAYREACDLAKVKAEEWGEALQAASDRDMGTHHVSQLAVKAQVETTPDVHQLMAMANA